MKLSTLLLLPTHLASLVYSTPTTTSNSNSYTEHLHLRPLPAGNLYAGFTFTSTTPLSAYTSNHFRYFPRSLAQILQYTHTAELHLRFALGRWDDENWGRRPREGGREGGNGVEIWSWMAGPGDGGDVGVEERWGDLVNGLSGLFCASLNFIDSTRTVRPVLSFEPEGDLEAMQNMTGEKKQGKKLQLLHGMLPHEVVCTENLTPFLKLLPCKGKAGISSLLDGHKVFDANWQTMAVDVRPICTSEGSCVLEIEQTVDMVLDIQRSMRPRESPIPRPPPIEEMVCDEGKAYNGLDTCYPKAMEGEVEWSLGRIFGRAVRGSCSLGEKDREGKFDLTVDVPAERTVEVIADGTVPQRHSGDGRSRSYAIPEGKDFDISLPHQILPDSQHHLFSSQPPLYASRQITGYGAERGGIHTTLTNPGRFPQRIVSLESLPWFLRPYMHTLHVEGGKVEKMFYTPLLDRKRGTHLELEIEVEGGSTVELTYEFEKAGLRYTEYPPDANRGFDVGAAVIRVLPSNHSSSNLSTGPGLQEDGKGSYYIRTTSLLLPLPTPDFSMPYNVIILTSTVLALGFGSVFNLLVRRFVLVEEVPVGMVQVVAVRIRGLVGRLRGRVGDAGDGKAGDGGKEEGVGKEIAAKKDGAAKKEAANDEAVNAKPRNRKKDR